MIVPRNNELVITIYSINCIVHLILAREKGIRYINIRTDLVIFTDIY
jgi:hypothetical protein